MANPNVLNPDPLNLTPMVDLAAQLPVAAATGDVVPFGGNLMTSVEAGKAAGLLACVLHVESGASEGDGGSGSGAIDDYFQAEPHYTQADIGSLN